jgi:hypothetical protein
MFWHNLTFMRPFNKRGHLIFVFPQLLKMLLPPQAKELLDHLEGVLSNQPVEIVRSQGYVEIKPQGVSKGQALQRILEAADDPSVSAAMEGMEGQEGATKVRSSFPSLRDGIISPM